MSLRGDEQVTRSDVSAGEMEWPWLPMEIAPQDRRIDLRAERWVSGHERLRVEIFPRCRWCAGGTVRHPAPYWRRLPTGWTPTHWRDPEPAT